MITFPRELHVWLQSLNLTYKITNPKRDLSNGWVFAEIFSREYPDDIEMYQYDNGFKLDKKINNWEHLTKFFKKKQIPIEFADYDPVIHCAPDASYKLLKKIYKLITGREIDDSLQPIQQQHQQDSTDPDYAKPTIAKKMKDHELARITDAKKQTDKAKTVITTHNEMLRTERLNPERYTKTKRGFAAVKHVELASAKVLSQTKRGLRGNQSKNQNDSSNNGEQPPSGDVKPVQVKTANKSIRVMRMEANQKRENQNKLPGGIQEEDSDELILDNILVDIVGQNLANKMSKGDPEYKNFKENYDKIIQYFTDRFQYITDELIFDIFQEMNDRQEEIVNVLCRNMLDFCDLIRFFSKCFKQINPMVTIGNSTNEEGQIQNKGKNIFQLMNETLAQIANKLLNNDPLQTEVYFLEYGIDELLDIMVDNVFKRNDMVYLLYCFVQNTTNAHLRVLQKIKEKIGSTKKDAYYFIISKLLLYESEDISPEIYNFYLRDAAQGIYQQSPITRTKCISILSYFSRIQLGPILPLIPILQKMSREDHWELKGQLLILCSNALLFFNTQVDENDNQYRNGSGDDDRIVETSNEQSRLHQSNFERSPTSKLKGQVGGTLITEQVIQNYTPMIFDIIHTILTSTAPKATIKIGLIYLAKILHFYPEYTATYLQILLNAPDNIRSATLEVEPLPGTEEEVYVSGSNTDKYRTYGAPHEWNSLYIAQALEKYVISNNLENLEWAHIEIFEACLQQDFKDDELDQWLTIFSSLKNYLFISLCYRDFSNTSIEILKKFFCHSTMQPNILKECLEIFIKTLQLLYQPDCDNDCKQNVREFLEFLHDYTDSTQDLKDFVYNSIKSFAELSQKAYQTSNLIDLMNKVVEARRGDIFEDGIQSMRNSQQHLTHTNDDKMYTGGSRDLNANSLESPANNTHFNRSSMRTNSNRKMQ